MKSINKFIVETYKEDRALKTTIQNGFAMVSQKVTVKGLRLLADAIITNAPAVSTSVDGISATGPLTIKAGSTVFIKESSLQSQPWAKVTLSAEGIEGDFMIVDPAHVEFVSEK